VRGHLLCLGVGFGALALIFLPVGLVLFDAIWTRALEGHALTADGARLLGLAVVDPPTAAHRREILERALWLGVGAGALALPPALALAYYQVWILQRVNHLLRVRLVERLQSLSLRFHGRQRIGDALYRAVQDSAMATQLVELLLLVPAANLARFGFGLAVCALFSWKLAALLLALVPLLVGLGALATRPLRIRFRAAREAQSALTSRVQEAASGIRVIKAFGAEKFEEERFERESRAAFAAAYAARGLFAKFTVGLFWLSALALVAGSAVAALLTAESAEIRGLRALGLSSLGIGAWTLGLFNYAKLRLGDGASSGRFLLRTWGRAQDVAVGLDRVFELLDLEPAVRDAPDARPFESLREGLRAEGVHFAYTPERAVLAGVDFDAPVGSIVALVGATGAGKSTLMALILRLMDPQAGRILVDGRDLREIELASWRRGTSVALQENLLFRASVAENIRYAAPNASDAALREAARVACADEFIAALPRGYATPLGERGAGLSTGQRQRLSLARALLKDPRVLLLDEPTAALDPATEARVLANLRRWAVGRLVFLVTHRLSTLRHADRVLVLADGRIAASGDHAGLHESSERYRQLLAPEPGELA
jgi:ATP-binding cassette subfamily B protein